MERFPETRSPLASAAAASLALHAAVVLAVILWAADSAPRLLHGDSGGLVTLSLVGGEAAGLERKGDDGRSAGIPARPAKAAKDRPEQRAPDTRESAVDASMRETPPRGDAGKDHAVAGAVVTARGGTADGGLAVVPVSADAGRGMAGAGVQVAGAIPRYRDNPRPEYPRAARLKGWEGLVLVDAEVGADGKVEDVRLKASSGHAVLDRSALAAVRDWRFEPGRRMGVPVRMRVDVPVRFVLREK